MTTAILEGPRHMSKGVDHKARATLRNQRRAVANAATSARTLDPAEVMRAQIRAVRDTARDTERRKAIRLQRGLRDPEPDETVNVPLAKAAAQRDLADALNAKARIRGKAGEPARQKRKEHLTAAKLLELDAAAARVAQLAQHWSAEATAETIALEGVRARVNETESDVSRVSAEVHDWVRDEHGALVIGKDGFPKLNTEIRTPLRRTRQGLDWLFGKGRITAEQRRIGGEAAAIWEAAASAAEPGRAEVGSLSSPGGKSSPGPADWRLTAMRRAKSMEAAIQSFVDGPAGAQMVQTCKAICWRGETVASLSADDRYEAVRIEERLKLGLALIRYWIYAGGSKIEA